MVWEPRPLLLLLSVQHSAKHGLDKTSSSPRDGPGGGWVREGSEAGLWWQEEEGIGMIREREGRKVGQGEVGET